MNGGYELAVHSIDRIENVLNPDGTFKDEVIFFNNDKGESEEFIFTKNVAFMKVNYE